MTFHGLVHSNINSGRTVEENKTKITPPSLRYLSRVKLKFRTQVDLPPAHFGILKLLNKFLTYYPQQKRHRHPNGKKGEENDTPVADRKSTRLNSSH